MDTLFHVLVTRFTEVIRKCFDSHLLRLTVTHQDQYCPRQGRSLDSRGVTLRHALKHRLNGGKDRRRLSSSQGRWNRNRETENPHHKKTSFHWSTPLSLDLLSLAPG